MKLMELLRKWGATAGVSAIKLAIWLLEFDKGYILSVLYRLLDNDNEPISERYLTIT